MKERPILFKAEMVKAILASTKTQTRRIVKRNPPFERDGQFEWYPGGEKAGFHAAMGTSTRFDVPSGWAADWCPYGSPGDRLWARETFLPVIDACEVDPKNKPGWMEYTGKGPDQQGYDGPTEILYRATDDHHPKRWRPGIHMPRWASRITLEVTNVRVERLQSLTDADAIAEGIEEAEEYGAHKNWKLYGEWEPLKQITRDPKWSYQTLWEAINGKDSWKANPWVWVVEFKKL